MLAVRQMSPSLRLLRPWAGLVLGLLVAACSQPATSQPDGGATAPVASSATATIPTAPSGPMPPPVREGGALARSPLGDVLYVADEDHAVVRRVTLPLEAQRVIAVKMPGAPAQVVALLDRVLVTIRDPGLLLVMRPDDAAGLVETARVSLPADAWGIAVTPDLQTALVTSAWTHQVSAVDLAAGTKRWSVDVAREPRGLVVRPDGVAYVTHLVGAALTRIDDLAADPKVRRVELPAGPLRAPSGKSLNASLGYAAALSGDGKRLFVARHALGAMGTNAWFGAATVDVLLTANDAPLAPPHSGRLPFLRSDKDPRAGEIGLPGGSLTPFTQPRAVLYRQSTRSVLVAGEGDDRVVEMDALAVDPTLAILRTYQVGALYDPVLPVAGVCAAPSGMVLSRDEGTLWVFCHGTYDLVALALDPHTVGAPFEERPPAVLHLADDPLDAEASLGRRIFYNATDRVTSGGLACAGCHPEGRDDGHVWHEAKINTDDGANVNFLGVSENAPEEDRLKGFPRRTPMLAGRVGAAGPYGWHGESPDLAARIKAGLGIHRWGGIPLHAPENLEARAGRLIPFLRRGLVPPPHEARDLAPDEERGKAIFVSDEARCARCHVPESDYTDRTVYPLPPLRTRADFDDERGELKTPSLRFVVGRAPYLHDGSAATLEQLVDQNNDRMGKTNQLSKDDRAALVAFLRTL